MGITYTFIRSKRKTIGISVKRDGSVILRAPMRCSRREAEAFLRKNMEWVERTRRRIVESAEMASEGKVEAFPDEELKELGKAAVGVISGMVKEVAEEMGVSYGRVTVRAQKTRWGSCSSKGNLNFNCLLMLLPESVRRYVVVHELCHRKEMNHSKAFWNEVGKYHPGYREDRKLLKELGGPLMERLRMR